MECVGWPVGVSSSVPCPGCVHAAMLVNVLRQGMHPECLVACHTVPLPQYTQHPPRPMQVGYSLRLGYKLRDSGSDSYKLRDIAP